MRNPDLDFSLTRGGYKSDKRDIADIHYAAHRKRQTHITDK